MLAGDEKESNWEFHWKVNSSTKLFQQLRVGARLCRVGSRVLGKGAITVEQ